MNIEISSLQKHFLLKTGKNDKTEKNDKITEKKKNNIIEHNFYSVNEANISHKIKKIPYYSNYFMILEDYDYINISSGQNFEKIDKTKQYLLFTYKKHLFSFDKFLFQLNPKLLIFNMISTFSYLLQSFIHLNTQNIVYFQFSSENIVFSEELRENPLLQNFQLSLQISKLTPEYMTNILKKTKDYTLKPLEIHLLFYLIENNMDTISYSFIEEIVEVFMKNMKILCFFSESYKESFKNGCISSLKKYINQPKKEIMLDILQYCRSWDIYSISLFYLHIFANISRVFSLKKTFINEIILILAKNIHPDPSKRGNISDLLDSHKKLLNCDWFFINELNNEKMQEFYDIFNE